MNAEIVAVGTELLLGFVVNTDTVFLGRVLAGLGINCYYQTTVGDNPDRLGETIRAALDRSDLVITCGGLGPTVDDITLETLAHVADRRLILNKNLLSEMKKRFARLKIRMPATNIRQAMIPEGAMVFQNEGGTAPGWLLKLHGKLLVALPGPPAELIPMVNRFLIPQLKPYSGKTVIVSKTLKITGRTESEIDIRVRDLLALKGAVTVGIYAHPGQVDLRITAKTASAAAATRLTARVESTIRRRLGNLVYGTDEETLESVTGKLLKKKKLLLAAAESITGGLIGHRLTEIAGSSDYFLGGVVAYSNTLKTIFLSVPSRLLTKHGAVSSQTAAAMATGIRAAAGADLGLAVTGIAGPAGGTPKKPVGLVYIALSGPRGTKTERHHFSGGRSAVKFKASQAALNMVRLYLLPR